MKNNMFCVSKKFCYSVCVFLMLLLVFFINSKIGSTRLGSSPKAFGECWTVLREGKFYIKKPELCFGNIGGFVCGSPVRFGGTWLINRKTGLMTKYGSLKACNEKIVNLPALPTPFPKKLPTKTPTPIPKKTITPTNTPKTQTPVTKKQEDYVVSVTLNKVDNVNYELFINQINFGKNTNSTTKITIVPLIAGDTSSSYRVNNECMTNGGRIEKLTLAKAEVIIITSRNNFNISVTGKNLDGVDNFSFLNTSVNYSVVGKSVGAVITKTILDRGDGQTISIKGCFTET